MKLIFFNKEEFCEDLPEVSNSKIEENKRITKDGLFSQQIFGPSKSYHCACSKDSFKGPKYKYPTCGKCDVEITTRDRRKTQFAKIVLPFKVLDPIFYYIITGKKSSTKKILDDLLYFRAVYWQENKDEAIIRLKEDDTIPEGGILYSGLDGVVKYIKKVVDVEDTKFDKPQFKFIRENIHKITGDKLIVIPPDYRPCGKIDKKGRYMADDMNFHYSQILKISEEIKKSPIALDPQSDLFKNNYRYVQNLVLKLYDYILDRMSKKNGLIRSNILGKRVDFSGRAVISPSPELKLDECGVPYWMILEILKPHLIAYLVNRRVCRRYNQASRIIDDCIQSKDDKLFELVQDFSKDKIAVLNRQPTLHRLGMLAFKVKPHLGKTIQIHPMVCPPFNADFDGDAMAIYFPITEDSKQDLQNNIGIWNNLISPTDIELVPAPNQDIILGIYSLTKD